MKIQCIPDVKCCAWAEEQEENVSPNWRIKGWYWKRGKRSRHFQRNRLNREVGIVLLQLFEHSLLEFQESRFPAGGFAFRENNQFGSFCYSLKNDPVKRAAVVRDPDRCFWFDRFSQAFLLDDHPQNWSAYPQKVSEYKWIVKVRNERKHLFHSLTDGLQMNPQINEYSNQVMFNVQIFMFFSKKYKTYFRIGWKGIYTKIM